MAQKSRSDFKLIGKMSGQFDKFLGGRLTGSTTCKPLDMMHLAAPAEASRCIAYRCLAAAFVVALNLFGEGEGDDGLAWWKLFLTFTWILISLGLCFEHSSKSEQDQLHV